MADTGTCLKAFLQSTAAIAALVGNRVFQDHVPQSMVKPQVKDSASTDFITFRKSDSRKERCLGDAVGTPPFSTTYDMDAVSTNPRRAKAISEALNTALDGYVGAFADSTVQGIFCENQADEYENFDIPADAGLHIASQRVEVIPR